jgi:hypothetical protein
MKTTVYQTFRKADPAQLRVSASLLAGYEADARAAGCFEEAAELAQRALWLRVAGNVHADLESRLAAYGDYLRNQISRGIIQGVELLDSK